MSEKALTKSLCRKWIKALRSGKYKQGRCQLVRGNQYGKYYCCLGVAEEVCGLERKNSQILHSVRGLSIGNIAQLIDMNDRQKRQFSEIANFIEKKIFPKCPDE
jgi:hypothetical protein